MDERHAGRLRKLADFLDELEPDKFDLGTWSDSDDRFADAACFTTACAGGWATTIPEFREAGFRLYCGSPCFGVGLGLSACERFFGLTFDQAHSIFLSDGYENGERTLPAVVARRLRAAADGASARDLLKIG